VRFIQVTLLNPYPDSPSLPTYPSLGLAYIGAVLEKNNYEVNVIDSHMLSYKIERTVDKILTINPDILGIHLNIGNFFSVKMIYESLKNEEFTGKIVIGGPLSVSYDKILKFSDYVILGEGEKSFIDLLDYLRKGKNIKNLDGVAFKRKNKIVIKSQKFITNIDEIPFPAWHLFPPLKKYKAYCRKRPNIPISTSRGCPHLCIYCNKSVFGYKFRPRSPENVVKEIEFLINEYDAKELGIQDDAFTLDSRRVFKICDLIIEKNLDIQWKCDNGVRVETLSDELLKKMREAGCYMVAIGAETGNQSVSNKIGRNQDLKTVRKIAKMIKENGMVLKMFFQVGFPFDTPNTMKQTIRFAEELNPDIAQFAISTPLPGTKMFELIENEGKFLYDIWSSFSYYGGKSMFEIYDLKTEDIEQAFKQAYSQFYLKPKKIISMLKNTRSTEEIRYFLGTFSYIFRSMLR
jgi:radical SAM superfamily enzyme YgiQ (UPF0313 family)